MPYDCLERIPVSGVTASGATVGTIAQASATWAVKPPSRPTMPQILAPTSLAYSSATTKLTLVFSGRLHTADGQDQDQILFVQTAALQPVGKGRIPALVVDARCQF